MEPWQQEQVYQHHLSRPDAPVCLCCGDPITTQRCFNMKVFGIAGYGCERCVENAMVWTLDAEE